ncbi:hypothetical protein, partial [Cupriavidus sp. a3]
MAQRSWQRWPQQKKIAATVDETKKALHNLVSLLQTTQRAERQSREAKFFNKQTTDKCGRWVADAAVFGQCCFTSYTVLAQQNVTGSSDLVSQFSESER